MFLCLSVVPRFDVSKLSLLSPVLQALPQEDKMWPLKVKGIFNLVLQQSSTGKTWKFRDKQSLSVVSGSFVLFITGKESRLLTKFGRQELNTVCLLWCCAGTVSCLCTVSLRCRI